MMFAGTITPLAAGTGNNVKLVTRAAATGGRIPAAIRHILVLAGQTHPGFRVEPVTTNTRFRLHLAQPGIDQRTMLGLLSKDACAGCIALLLQGLLLLCAGHARLTAGRRKNNTL